MYFSAKTPAAAMALGGVMAALAVTVMCFGGLIPIATYISPMLCMVILQIVTNICGRRIAWAWYGAVAILAVLLSSDKEAAAVFVFLGYYPIVKPWLDGRRFSAVWKLILFNGCITVMYWLLLRLIGAEALQEEFADISGAVLAVLLLLGNVTFFLLDYFLGMEKIKRIGKNGR